MARKTGRIQSKAQLLITCVLATSIAFMLTVAIDASGSQEAASPTSAPAPVTGQNDPLAPAAMSAAFPSEPSCPAGQTYIAPEQVAVEGMPTCLPIGSQLRESHVNPLYAEIAVEILRLAAPLDKRLEIRKPKVVCWSLQDWKEISASFRERDLAISPPYAGWVALTNRVINLSYHTCKRLDTIAYDGKTPSQKHLAAPVWTLAHETIHLGGIPDEGVADCYARQLTSHTAELLGLDTDDARTITNLSIEYAELAKTGTHYDDPDCHASGALDIGLDNQAWSQPRRPWSHL